MTITYTILSKIGDREINEDRADAFVSQDASRGLFIVADGLGGHSKGDVASRIAVETASESYQAENIRPPDIEAILCTIQKKLLERQQEEHIRNGIKTTAALLFVSKRKILYGYSGDTRIYRFFHSKCVFQTLDHSLPQALVKMGELCPEEIRGHSDRNKLLRVLGADVEQKMYTLGSLPGVSKGDVFLLCSDGLWEWVTEEEMEEILITSSGAEEWLTKMEKQLVHNAGGHKMDNYTAVSVWIS